MFDCHSFITHATIKELGTHSLSSKSYFVLLCWLISNYRFSSTFLRKFLTATNLLSWYDKIDENRKNTDFIPSDLDMTGWYDNPFIITPSPSGNEDPPEAVEKIIELLTELKENCSDDLDITICRDHATIQFDNGDNFVYCFYSQSPKLITNERI